MLVRQRPGTATGVIFITLEDETGIANLVIWSSLFEQQRGVVLSASMLECRGRVQREGDVIHVVCDQLSDLTPLLRTVGDRGQVQACPHGKPDDVLRRPRPGPGDAGVGGRRSLCEGPTIQVSTRSFH